MKKGKGENGERRRVSIFVYECMCVRERMRGGGGYRSNCRRAKGNHKMNRVDTG